MCFLHWTNLALFGDFEAAASRRAVNVEDIGKE